MSELCDVLVLNCGSSSLKFAIVNGLTGESLLTGLAERLGEAEAQLSWRLSDEKQELLLPKQANHRVALEKLVEIIYQNKFEQKLIAIGHRVVHGGEQFTRSVVINDSVKQAITEVAKLAPLHNPANLIGIEVAESCFTELSQVAVFDTAFHQTMPEQAYLYALPKALYQQHGIRRYGFHGTSHAYVAEQAATLLHNPLSECNLITAHLGNGCSVAAIKEGQSVDTSMGLTPLSGVMMGTRSGDLDPGILIYLVNSLGYSSAEVGSLLNKESGLKGLSELSNDCRTLEEAMHAGNKNARLALEVFCYLLAKQIAAFMVPIGHLDALVFTGGIGENSEFIRAQVLKQLTFLGITLNTNANQQMRFGAMGAITTNDSVPAFVIPTNEEFMIARDTLALAATHKA